MSSNRDENPERKLASAPQLIKTGKYKTLAPIDGDAGGTWLGIRNDNTIIILLNGGFYSHQKQIAYIKSRGLVVLELLAQEVILDAWQLLKLQNIEPFTLVVVQQGQLYQLVWDGLVKHHKTLDASQPHIWSSATLYTSEVHQQRKLTFEKEIGLLPKDQYSTKKLHQFLTTAMPENTENRFVMKRGKYLQTLSISLIEMNNKTASITYYNLNKPNALPIIKCLSLSSTPSHNTNYEVSAKKTVVY